jgi:hypothetical protein
MSTDLSPLPQLPGLTERVRRDLPRIVNRLLGQSFLYQDLDADQEDYYTVFRHQPAFAAALALAGFTLIHDDYHRVFQVVSDYSYCRTRFKLDETLMIVVLRKLYEEQAEQLRLAADPVVTVGEVREEYRTITGADPAPAAPPGAGGHPGGPHHRRAPQRGPPAPARFH